MTLTEAKKILNSAGYYLTEAYEDATPEQIAGMKQRLDDYIKNKSEFKIKSKANPLGLVVSVEKDENGILTLYNANTWKVIAHARTIDEMIKKIYDIQSNLNNMQHRETFELDLVSNVMELINDGTIVILPDEFYDYSDTFSKYQAVGDMVYLHGEAEDDAGYDICHILTKDGKPLTKEQRFDCVIANPNKGFVPSYLYFWYDYKFANPRMPYGMPRGLICYKTDIEGCKYAQECLDKRSDHI